MDFTIARKKGSGAIIWSEDQKHYIVSEYTIKDKTLKELSQEFGVQPTAIRNLLRKENITITNKKTKNYPRDSHYFDEVNSHDKAYWLGMMYSDGCVQTNGNEISLGLKDQEHVEKFRNALQAVNKVITITDNRWEKPCLNYRFTIRDKGLKEGLVRLGCIPNKSYCDLHFPNIPDEFMWDFIRGYFDGDGSLYFTINKYVLSFVGGKTFLQDLQKKLNKENISLCQNSVSKITYDLKICGKKDVFKILNSIYKDSTEETRLNRKYETAQKCFEFLGRKHS